ncbi:MAG: phospho-N-acetylmuramoyl-pentapeptide-transferase [Chloroflexi bacterium B3_Chlor]|nr:MAG: phospho-N-acetylmuramoyl-pentapeptide-transferase [Chloroflexi bacterium B3_Chlor]
MASALALGVATFLLALPFGSFLLKYLTARGIGEQIRIDGPISHQLKTGTPTMGGIGIVVPAAIMTALFNLVGHESILLPLGTAIACAIVGAVDDWASLRRSRRKVTGATIGQKSGLIARYKFAWLIVIAVAAAVVLHFVFLLESLAVPSIPTKFSMGLWYFPVAVFVIVASANAVNLTDGLDGLAGSTSAIAFAAYGVIALLQGQLYLVAFCFTMTGATMAFLWYNAYPAQLFMGDTGSLALGGTLGVIAMMTGQWLLLPIVGIVFVAETLSVILQVWYFKLTGGKRIFKMTPLHHHLELLGWSEVQIVQRFWLVGMLAAMLGIALALL